MGQKDIACKEFIGDNIVFSDVINYRLGKGEKIIDPNDLKDLNVELVDEGDSDSLKRDILKEAIIKEDKNITYVLFGIENQSYVDNGMPLRCMRYDYESYLKQARALVNERKHGKIRSGDILSNLTKKDKIKPVITIVIYFGKGKWSGPKRLTDLLDIDKNSKIFSYINDYEIYLIEPNLIPDSDLEKMMDSNFGKVMWLFKNSSKVEVMKNLINNSHYSSISNSAARLLNEYLDLNLQVNYDKKESFNMCKGQEQFKAECKEEGRVEGRAEGKANVILKMKSKGMSDEAIAELLDLPIEFVKEVK